MAVRGGHDGSANETSVLIQIDSATVAIRLNDGTFTLIDAADLALVQRFKWRRWRHKKKVTLAYAVTTLHGTNKEEFGVQELKMHRLLMGLPKCPVDHIDGDGLNNRRSNLRNATFSQNCQNSRKAAKQKSSRFKGVFKTPRAALWTAQIQVNRRPVVLGKFTDELAAARAYDAAALQHFGEFARLNFPVERLLAEQVLAPPVKGGAP